MNIKRIDIKLGKKLILSYNKTIDAFLVNIRIIQHSKVMFLRLKILMFTSKECTNCIM